MLYRSSADVTIPAHKLTQFKSWLTRHAPSEHFAVELGPISAWEVRRVGPNAVVRVLIDSVANFEDLGDFAEQWETEDSNQAALESIAFAIGKVGGDWEFDVATDRVE